MNLWRRVRQSCIGDRHVSDDSGCRDGSCLKLIVIKIGFRNLKLGLLGHALVLLYPEGLRVTFVPPGHEGLGLGAFVGAQDSDLAPSGSIRDLKHWLAGVSLTSPRKCDTSFTRLPVQQQVGRPAIIHAFPCSPSPFPSPSPLKSSPPARASQEARPLPRLPLPPPPPPLSEMAVMQPRAPCPVP